MSTMCPGTMGCIVEGGGGGGAATWLAPVATFAALPVPPAPGDGSVAVVLDVNVLYQWDASTAAWIPITAFGATLTHPGNPNGIVGGYLGQQCLDTVNRKMYVCTSNPNGTQWKRT